MRHGARRALFLFLTGFAAACATVPRRGPEPEPTRGVASWYGEEFAGRTTANGEIFDPLSLTAAHRTLPFGTILDVTNRANGKTVRVRINDRGPFIQNRLIDLSWAAAREIGMVDTGLGEVDLAVVRLGAGELEPPVPFDVTVAQSPPPVPVIPSSPPEVPLLPVRPSEDPEAVVDRVDVQQERSGVEVRRRVAADGKSFEEVPVEGAAARAPLPSRPASTGGFVVQAGAFASEANARALQERLVAIGQRAWVDAGDLFRVRVGPFRTRDEAIDVREQIEARGMSAIVVRE